MDSLIRLFEQFVNGDRFHSGSESRPLEHGNGDVFRPKFFRGPGRLRQVRDHSRQGISPCGIDELGGLRHVATPRQSVGWIGRKPTLW